MGGLAALRAGLWLGCATKMSGSWSALKGLGPQCGGVAAGLQVLVAGRRGPIASVMYRVGGVVPAIGWGDSSCRRAVWIGVVAAIALGWPVSGRSGSRHGLCRIQREL